MCKMDSQLDKNEKEPLVDVKSPKMQKMPAIALIVIAIITFILFIYFIIHKKPAEMVGDYVMEGVTKRSVSTLFTMLLLTMLPLFLMVLLFGFVAVTRVPAKDDKMNIMAACAVVALTFIGVCWFAYFAVTKFYATNLMDINTVNSLHAVSFFFAFAAFLFNALIVAALTMILGKTGPFTFVSKRGLTAVLCIVSLISSFVLVGMVA